MKTEKLRKRQKNECMIYKKWIDCLFILFGVRPFLKQSHHEFLLHSLRTLIVLELAWPERIGLHRCKRNVKADSRYSSRDSFVEYTQELMSTPWQIYLRDFVTFRRHFSRLFLEEGGECSVFEWFGRGICIFFSYFSFYSAQSSENCRLLRTHGSSLSLPFRHYFRKASTTIELLTNLLTPSEYTQLVDGPMNKENR